MESAAEIVHGGLRTIVLEQSEHIGGRMWNTAWEGRSIEIGANWIEGIPQSENPIWALAQAIGLKGNYTEQEDGDIKPILMDQRGIVPKAEADALHARLASALSEALNVSCQRQKAGLADISLRQALLQAGWPPSSHQTPLERTLEFFVRASSLRLQAARFLSLGCLVCVSAQR